MILYFPENKTVRNQNMSDHNGILLYELRMLYFDSWHFNRTVILWFHESVEFLARLIISV
jgi:hypothetical protein